MQVQEKGVVYRTCVRYKRSAGRVQQRGDDSAAGVRQEQGQGDEDRHAGSDRTKQIDVTD